MSMFSRGGDAPSLPDTFEMSALIGPQADGSSFCVAWAVGGCATNGPCHTVLGASDPWVARVEIMLNVAYS